MFAARLADIEDSPEAHSMTRLQWITMALWVLLLAYLGAWGLHAYRHRPCADLPGSKLIVDPVRACEVKP